MNNSTLPDYHTKLLLKAAESDSRERRRQLCWKVLREMGCDATSPWWVLKMNFKLWLHRLMWGHDYD